MRSTVGLSKCQLPSLEKTKRQELTHCDNVASYCIAKGEVPSDGNKHIQKTRNTNARSDHSSRSELRIITYLVQD